MAQFQKYADLPDLDSAPDLYETPEPSDDKSANPSSASRLPKYSNRYFSDDEDDDDDDGSDDDRDGRKESDRPIDRTHMRPQQARSQFQPARVDARGVDFSDRVVRGTKGSYRTSTSTTRRGRKVTKGAINGDDAYLLGDLSDEEDETLERKLARLHREVAEVKSTLDERRHEEEEQGKGVDRNGKDENMAGIDPVTEERITQLLGALDSISIARHKHNLGPEPRLSQQIQQYQKASSDVATQANSSMKPGLPSSTTNTAITSAATRQQEQLHALHQISDLDSRLTAMEQILGVDAFELPFYSSSTNTTSNPTNNNNSGISTFEPPKPLLPTLSLLHDQITILNSVATTNNSSSSSSNINPKSPTNNATTSLPSSNTLDIAGQRAQKLMNSLSRFESERVAARHAREREWERQRDRDREREPYTNGLSFSASTATRLYNIRNEEQQRLAAIAGGSGAGGVAAGTAAGIVGGTAGDSAGAADMSDADQVHKINALYTTLSTIEGFAPTVPLLLERLRSLNVVHANAASAGEMLAELERRQAGLGDEVDEWREGLRKVEESVGENERASVGNAKVLEGWVRELEGRVESLS